ncbi:MAG: hypothetical protein FalmKO_46830 [Falsiruegeria mediterranea]
MIERRFFTQRDADLALEKNRGRVGASTRLLGAVAMDAPGHAAAQGRGGNVWDGIAWELWETMGWLVFVGSDDV